MEANCGHNLIIMYARSIPSLSLARWLNLNTLNYLNYNNAIDGDGTLSGQH